jgi:hypothetical protein
VKTACCKIIFQVFQMFQRYVGSVVYRCCKGDRDVAHVVMAIYIYFKCMFQMFHLFQTYVASVLSGCCKSRSGCCIYIHVANICFKCFQVFHMYICRCLIWMLHMFAMVFFYFSGVFASVSNACFKCFTYLLLYMLQLLHLDISKVDRAHGICMV